MMSIVQLREKILPAAFQKDGTNFLRCELDTASTGEDQFASTVVFVTAVVEKNKEEHRIPLIIKFEPLSVSVRELMDTNIQFYNEVYMYSKVLPFLNKDNIIEDIFPEFYYGIGSIGNSDENVIIVEDLRPHGYRLTENKAFLDFDHLAVALSKLGQFHALSYAAKERSQGEFVNLVSNIEEYICRKQSKIHRTVKACIHRAVDPLVKQGKHVEILQRFLKLVDNNYDDFVRELVSPEDPLAVICHGDFCRNNMLFKYADGKPIDVKFFDIATSRYSSPVTDISFFLFLNSSEEVRNVHWDNLLDIYHKSLSTSVLGTKVPSIEEIKEAMKQKAVYGFIPCSYFLPVMMFDFNTDMEKMSAMSVEERSALLVSHGGEDGTKVLCDIVQELVRKECLTLEHSFM